MTAQEVLREVGEWAEQDRLELVHALWDQLVDDGFTPAIDDELNEELDRRWAAHKADPTKTYSLAEVLAHVRRPK